MGGIHGPPSLNPRYYAHIHERVLCNAECVANIVVDDDHHGFIFMYYGVFVFDVFRIVCCGFLSYIMDYCMYYL
jgi:hypothetical protein